MRITIALVIITSVFFSLTTGLTPVRAQMIPASQMISVRVDNKPLNVEYIVIADEVFVPAEEMQKVFQDDITWDRSTFWVSIGNKETPVKGLSFQDKVFLPLKAMAMLLGHTVDWDSAKNVLNIKTKKVQSEQKIVAAEKQPETGEKPETAGEQQPAAGEKPETSGGQQQAKGEKQETPGEQQATAAEKQPVTGEGSGERRRRAITISLFREDPITNVLEQVTALRIYADVKNGRNRLVKNVVAHCIFRYPEGEVYFEDTVTIEKMDPGESIRVIFYSINPVPVGKLKYEMTVQVQKPAAPRND